MQVSTYIPMSWIVVHWMDLWMDVALCGWDRYRVDYGGAIGGGPGGDGRGRARKADPGGFKASTGPTNPAVPNP